MSVPALFSFVPRAWRGLSSFLVLLAFAGGAALAQQAVTESTVEADPPGRVARLSLAEGGVRVADGDNGGTDWGPAEPNRPLTNGDRVWTEPGARAEVHVGSNALRLDGQTSLDIAQLDDQTAQLRLTQGRLSLRVRQLWDGERIEIGTPNLALVVTQPGLYRVEVDPAQGITRVAVATGAATLYGENGESRSLQAAQQLALGGRNLGQVAGQEVARQDPFERWVAERDRSEDESIAARYVSRDTIGYQQLDGNGDWQNDANYGAVWYPRVTIANWAPYRYGQWRWVAPWGWTWVDDAPWGFAPFHYGRWAYVGNRWGWVPGPRGPRPVYAPALVGFVGGAPGHAPHWNLGANRPGVGWFPLAPGEAWRPGFRASPRYLANVNRHPPQIAAPIGRDRFAYQHRPDAVTAVTAADFERGRPVRNHWQRVGENELAGTRIAPPPARGGYGSRFAERGVEAREPRGPSAPAAAIGAPLVGSPTQPGVQAGGQELRPRPPNGAWRDPQRDGGVPSAQQQERWREQENADRERFRREHAQRDQGQREQMQRDRIEQNQREQREQIENIQRQQLQVQRAQAEREQAEQQRRQQGYADFQRAQQERQQRDQAEQGFRQQQLQQNQRAQQERFQRDQQEQMQRQQQQAQREQFQRERQQREQEARSRGQVMGVDQPQRGPTMEQRRAERERNQSIQRGEGYRGQGS